MEIAFIILGVIQGIVFGLFTQALASAKGYTQTYFFWIGFWFSFLGLIFVLGLPNKPQQASPPTAPPLPPHQERVNIFISINGKTIGPYAKKQIRDLLATGVIPPDAMFWKKGMEDWQPLTTLQ